MILQLPFTVRCTNCNSDLVLVRVDESKICDCGMEFAIILDNGSLYLSIVNLSGRAIAPVVEFLRDD